VASITATTTLGDGTPLTKTLVYITSDVDLAHLNDNTVAAYQVDATSGAVTPQTNLPSVTGSVPTAVLAVKTTPTGGSGGLFVYVANAGSGIGADSISIFKVCTDISTTCTDPDVTATNNTLRNLILNAYGIFASPHLLSGGPGWIDSERYDVEAKAEANAIPAGTPNKVLWEKTRLMLRTLLENRFNPFFSHWSSMGTRLSAYNYPMYAVEGDGVDWSE